MALKVIHFAETLYGGVITHINELLSDQSEKYAVTIFCPEDQAHLVDGKGVNVVTFEPCGRGFFGVIRLFLIWRECLRNSKFDIVHLHSTYAGLVGRLFPLKSRVIYTPHGWSFLMDVHPYKKALFKAVEFILSFRCDVIVGVSADEIQKASSAKIPKEKCVLINNGLRDAEWAPLVEGRVATKLLFIGRYDRQKGYDVLMGAADELMSLGFSIRTVGKAVISGQDGIGNSNVEDLGWLTPSEVCKAISSSDIILMPSRWEGFPYVALEAMRAGRPIVAASVGGLSEVVDDRVTGILFASGSVSGLISACNEAKLSGVATLGSAGRRRYEALYSAELMNAKLGQAYKYDVSSPSI